MWLASVEIACLVYVGKNVLCLESLTSSFFLPSLLSYLSDLKKNLLYTSTQSDGILLMWDGNLAIVAPWLSVAHKLSLIILPFWVEKILLSSEILNMSACFCSTFIMIQSEYRVLKEAAVSSTAYVTEGVEAEHDTMFFVVWSSPKLLFFWCSVPSQPSTVHGVLAVWMQSFNVFVLPPIKRLLTLWECGVTWIMCALTWLAVTLPRVNKSLFCWYLWCCLKNWKSLNQLVMPDQSQWRMRGSGRCLLGLSCMTNYMLGHLFLTGQF